MSNSSEQPKLRLSLYNEVRSLIDEERSIMHCSKATLVHLSHALEDLVLRHRIPALMFTGFQESTYWRQETERYRELATIAHQVCIFAGDTLPEDNDTEAIQITLEPDDPLRQEWFVLLLSDEFTAILTGQDEALPTTDEATRQFEAILNFEPPVINRVLDRLDTILTHYRPECASTLREARQRFAVSAPNPRYVTELTTSLIRYEERLKQRLRQERDFNQKLINSSAAYFVTIDTEGIIYDVNPVLVKTLGYDDEAAMLNRPLWEAFGTPDSEPQYQQMIGNLLGSETPVTYRSTMLTTTGDAIPVEWRSSIIRQTSSEPGFIFALGLDLRDRLRAENLQRQEERLRIDLEKERELSEIRTHFMSTVSHEFRTPLATILTSAEMMERYGADLQQSVRKKRVGRIKAQIAHLNAMVDDIQTIIRTGSGYIRLEPLPTNITPIVENIIQDMQTSLGSSHVITFDNQWTRESISADTRLLQHIYSNLISNAIKYTPPTKEITITLREENGYIVFRIEDNGIGITPEDNARLFEAFYRGQNVGTRGGTGLGLRIVADCVDIYGGEIHYTSGDDGTTFVVRLPINITRDDEYDALPKLMPKAPPQS